MDTNHFAVLLVLLLCGFHLCQSASLPDHQLVHRHRRSSNNTGTNDVSSGGSSSKTGTTIGLIIVALVLFAILMVIIVLTACYVRRGNAFREAERQAALRRQKAGEGITEDGGIENPMYGQSNRSGGSNPADNFCVVKSDKAKLVSSGNNKYKKYQNGNTPKGDSAYHTYDEGLTDEEKYIYHDTSGTDVDEKAFYTPEEFKHKEKALKEADSDGEFKFNENIKALSEDMLDTDNPGFPVQHSPRMAEWDKFDEENNTDNFIRKGSKSGNGSKRKMSKSEPNNNNDAMEMQNIPTEKSSKTENNNTITQDELEDQKLSKGVLPPLKRMSFREIKSDKENNLKEKQRRGSVDVLMPIEKKEENGVDDKNEGKEHKHGHQRHNKHKKDGEDGEHHRHHHRKEGEEGERKHRHRHRRLHRREGESEEDYQERKRRHRQKRHHRRHRDKGSEGKDKQEVVSKEKEDQESGNETSDWDSASGGSDNEPTPKEGNKKELPPPKPLSEASVIDSLVIKSFIEESQALEEAKKSDRSKSEKTDKEESNNRKKYEKESDDARQDKLFNKRSKSQDRPSKDSQQPRERRQSWSGKDPENPEKKILKKRPNSGNELSKTSNNRPSSGKRDARPSSGKRDTRPSSGKKDSSSMLPPIENTHDTKPSYSKKDNKSKYEVDYSIEAPNFNDLSAEYEV